MRMNGGWSSKTGVRVAFQGRFPATPSDRDFLEVLGLWNPTVFSKSRNSLIIQKGVPQFFLHGWFLKLWYPQNTLKWSFLVGKPMFVGYHHFRKHRHGGKSTSLSIDPPKKKGLNLFFCVGFGIGSPLDVTSFEMPILRVPFLRHCSKGQAFAHQDVAVHHVDLTDGLFLVQTILPIVNAVRGVRVLLFLAEIFAPLSTTFPTYSRSLKKQVRVCNLRVVLGHLRLEGLPLHAFRGADCQSDSDEFLANYCWWFRYPANHHLGCRNPCKQWDKLAINWCRISSINSSKRTNIENRNLERDSVEVWATHDRYKDKGWGTYCYYSLLLKNEMYQFSTLLGFLLWVIFFRNLPW